MLDLGKLHEKIAKICDLDGISIGKYEDKSTWKVQYKDEPSKEQLAKIAIIIKEQEVLTLEQDRESSKAKDYLQSTDWLVLRHLEQVTSSSKVSLSMSDFLVLCNNREEARKLANI